MGASDAAAYGCALVGRDRSDGRRNRVLAEEGSIDMQTTNDNYQPVTAGQSYYPEMGERHDGSALFERQVGYKGYYLKWSLERHTEALDTFKRLKIRPRFMEQTVGIKRGPYWTCCVTYEAGRKLQSYSVTELLLD